jgi:hypothetical protein
MPRTLIYRRFLAQPSPQRADLRPDGPKGGSRRYEGLKTPPGAFLTSGIPLNSIPTCTLVPRLVGAQDSARKKAGRAGYVGANVGGIKFFEPIDVLGRPISGTKDSTYVLAEKSKPSKSGDHRLARHIDPLSPSPIRP